MVLGRGKKGGLARYRAVMSFRLCNQGVRWKPHTEGAPAAAGHVISYSVQQSQSFFRYGDGSRFLWLRSGERRWLTPRPHCENTCAFTFWNHTRLNKMLALYLSLRVWEQLGGVGRQLSLAPPHPITRSQWFTKWKRHQSALCYLKLFLCPYLYLHLLHLHSHFTYNSIY